jgi:hypothetical protein
MVVFTFIIIFSCRNFYFLSTRRQKNDKKCNLKWQRFFLEQIRTDKSFREWTSDQGDQMSC